MILTCCTTTLRLHKKHRGITTSLTHHANHAMKKLWAVPPNSGAHANKNQTSEARRPATTPNTARHMARASGSRAMLHFTHMPASSAWSSGHRPHTTPMCPLLQVLFPLQSPGSQRYNLNTFVALAAFRRELFSSVSSTFQKFLLAITSVPPLLQFALPAVGPAHVRFVCVRARALVDPDSR